MKPRITFINMKQECLTCFEDDLYFDEAAECYMVDKSKLSKEHQEWLEAYYKEKEELIHAVQK